jgi:hypothetical protein
VHKYIRAAFVIITLAVFAALLATAPLADAPAIAQEEVAQEEPPTVDLGDDIVAPPEPPTDSRFRQFAAAVPVDPLGLVSNLDQLQLYTSGVDTFEVWKCQDNGIASFDLGAKVAEANGFITPYYEWLSGGTYSPVFTQGGTVPTFTNCQTYIRNNTSGTANAALAFGEWSGGWAGPGFWCFSPCSEANKKFPGNARYGQVGISVAFLAVLGHEMAHSIHWPHSYTGNRFTGPSVYEYDNAIDMMSGNRGVIGCCSYGTYPDPYATLAINRYAAGWIPTGDVVVHEVGTTETVLVEIGDAGKQMLVIRDGTSYWTLDTRVTSGNDPFPSVWAGVHVARINKSSPFNWGIERRTIPEPPNPFLDLWPPSEYSAPLDHVLHAGDSLVVGGHTIKVLAKEGDAFRVRITSTRFLDVPATHTFYNDIDYLADEGITQGCNPPGNTLYCPTGNVTRGQMAAFLVRALNLPAAGQDYFTDDDTSIFENDINRLAQAGITRGCNPPANDLYCPDTRVSREQMAAFLVRALNLTDNGGGNTFIDDNGSIFEEDIAKLAAAGITQGCNPPSNTKFCPTSTVTREQMAAFLHRALTP